MLCAAEMERIKMDALNLLIIKLGAEFTANDLIYGFIACLAAIWIGVTLAKKQANIYKGQDEIGAVAQQPNNRNLPIVNHIDYGDMRFLHLGTPWVQGSMMISKPYDIHLEYVQRMMGWMLLTDLDQIHHLQAMQLGLGAASLTKFCHLQLGMQTTAVELNPQVIETCRQWFKLPEDNAKLHVLQADAADIASNPEWHGKIDVLQVDLYDQEAACPALDSEAFYADCRQLLTQQGCMAVNLYGRDSSLAVSMQRIAKAFGNDTLWAFKPTTAGNTIVLAFRTPRAWDMNALLSQAKQIQARWPLPATKWLKTLKPVQG
jgi:spermidine synthase